MEKRNSRNKFNIILIMFFCCILLVGGGFSRAYAEDANMPSIMLTANDISLDRLPSGAYYSNEDVTVDFNEADNAIEYKITKNGIEEDWTTFNEAFVLPASFGVVDNYIINFAEVVNDVRGEEQVANIIIDQEKPMLLIISTSGGEYVDGVYSGQFLTYKIRQTDGGVGFETAEETLPVMWRTYNEMGEVLTNWAPMLEDGNNYVITLENPEITRVEFKTTDIAGNSDNMRVSVYIPADKPVIESVSVQPQSWVNGLAQETKNVIITVEESEVVVNDFKIENEEGEVIRDWEAVSNFAGGEYSYQLLEGNYSIRVRNADGLVSDIVNFTVDKFDHTKPNIEVTKIEYDRNNTVHAGRLYFEVMIACGEDGAPLEKVVYKKVGSEEEYEIKLAPINLTMGGSLDIYENIDSGIWIIAVYAESGLFESATHEMIELSEIETRWKDLISYIDFFDITLDNYETIELAEDFLDSWVKFGSDIDQIDNIVLDNYGAGGVRLLLNARDIYIHKESFLKDIINEIEDYKEQLLSDASVDKLMLIINQSLTALNAEQIEFAGEASELVEYIKQLKDNLVVRLESIKANAFDEIHSVPLGVEVFFEISGAIGLPASIVFDEGEEINLAEYKPFDLKKIFLYWEDENGERVDGNIVVEAKDGKSRIVNFEAVWREIEIVASERAGQTLENLKEQLPYDITWADETLNASIAGIYEVDAIITVDDEQIVSKVPFVILPKIEEKFSTTQRLKSIELPAGWEWENGTMYLDEGKNEYTVILTVNKSLEDGQIQSKSVKYILEIEAEKPAQPDNKGNKFLIIALIVVLVSAVAGTTVLYIKNKRKKQKSSENKF